MLTPSQLAILGADIAADPTLSTIPNTLDGAFDIAVIYNTTAVPDYIVWRTAVATSDVKTGIVWPEYIGRSVGEKSAFELMISNGVINAADTNIRQGIQDVFSGPNAAQTRANLIAIGQRKATRAEKLFATGTGTTVSPSTMSVEGNISFQDVFNARNL